MRYNFLLIFIILCSGHLQAVSLKEEGRDRIFAALNGECLSRSLYVATKLEVAKQLQKGAKTAEELAFLTKSDASSLYRLLHMLAGYDIFIENEEKTFSNNCASELLVKSTSDTLYSLMMFYGEEVHLTWHELLPSIQHGVPAFQLAFNQTPKSYFEENSARDEIFKKSLREKEHALNRSLLELYDFSDLKTLCEVGGINTNFSESLLLIHPELVLNYCYLPQTMEEQKKEIAGLNYIEIDYFKSVPRNFEAYLLNRTLHSLDDEQAANLLKNCSISMKHGSALILIDTVVLPDDDSIKANCKDLLMFAFTGHKERTLENIKNLLDSAGLEVKEIGNTATEYSVIIAKLKSDIEDNNN